MFGLPSTNSATPHTCGRTFSGQSLPSGTTRRLRAGHPGTQGEAVSTRAQASDGGALKAPPRAPQPPKKPAPPPQQAQPSGNGASSSGNGSRQAQPARSNREGPQHDNNQKRKGQDGRAQNNKPRFNNNKHANGKAYSKTAQREKRVNRDGAGQASLMTLDDDDEDILVHEAEADEPVAEAAELDQGPEPEPATDPTAPAAEEAPQSPAQEAQEASKPVQDEAPQQDPVPAASAADAPAQAPEQSQPAPQALAPAAAAAQPPAQASEQTQPAPQALAPAAAAAQAPAQPAAPEQAPEQSQPAPRASAPAAASRPRGPTLRAPAAKPQPPLPKEPQAAAAQASQAAAPPPAPHAPDLSSLEPVEADQQAPEQLDPIPQPSQAEDSTPSTSAPAAGPRKPSLRPPARMQRRSGALASHASYDQDDHSQAGPSAAVEAPEAPTSPAPASTDAPQMQPDSAPPASAALPLKKPTFKPRAARSSMALVSLSSHDDLDLRPPVAGPQASASLSSQDEADLSAPDIVPGAAGSHADSQAAGPSSAPETEAVEASHNERDLTAPDTPLPPAAQLRRPAPRAPAPRPPSGNGVAPSTASMASMASVDLEEAPSAPRGPPPRGPQLRQPSLASMDEEAASAPAPAAPRKPVLRPPTRSRGSFDSYDEGDRLQRDPSSDRARRIAEARQADAVFMSTGSGDSMDASMMGSVMASVDESGSGPVTASPDRAVGLTGPPKKVEAKPLSEAAKGRLDALRGRVAAVRQQRQGPGPGQGQGQRQAPGQNRKRGQKKPDLNAIRAHKGDRKARRARAAERDQAVQDEIFECPPGGMSVAQLAGHLAVDPNEVVLKLFMKGLAAKVNQVIDREAVKNIAAEYEVEAINSETADVADAARKTMDEDDGDAEAELLQPRPPVVTVMGHVDHGKTSLLDFIRKTKVAAGEAGGITQGIGAYTCQVPTGDSGAEQQITFLDTPGHEAFSAMRARGTRVTDIAIIMCAADDGVQPQTLEAISHARAAKVPMLVAINKIDKEGANPERAKTQLSEADLMPEEWGGSTPMVEISAKSGDGVDELLETLLLLAELEELKANPDKPARGTVIEAHMDRRRGATATLLVAAGTLRLGDVVAAGASFGKVRSMLGSLGEVKEASPSIAVQMQGLNSVPVAGDTFHVCENEAEARKLAEDIGSTLRLERLQQQAADAVVSSRTTQGGGEDPQAQAPLQLNFILKVDASGTLEAIRSAVATLPQEPVSVRFLHAAAGPVTQADVDLAASTQGIILAFNTRMQDSVATSAKQQNVIVQSYNIIYELIEGVRAAMEGELEPLVSEVALGEAEVRAVFGSGTRKAAGCMVTDGSLRADCLIKVVRNRRTIHQGQLSSLRRVREQVKEMDAGNECGVTVEDFSDWRQGDHLQAVELVSKRRTLEDAFAGSS